VARVNAGENEAATAGGAADSAASASPAGASGATASATAQDGAGRIPAAAAAKAGITDIVDLTGKQPEGVTAVEPTANGWLIAVEVIEDQRVPSSADIMATYEAELDNDGNLLAYRRTRRYGRGRADGGRRLHA
jgi:hypothetical protein